MRCVISNGFETLSNELLLDIFEYLDAYNLCQAFYGLNHRINTLFQFVNLHIVYDSSKENEIVWDIVTSVFSPSQIRILSSYNGGSIHERFANSVKENLHSVCLHEVHPEYMDKICEQFCNNNGIKYLQVVETRDSYDRETRSIIDSLLVDHGHRFVSLVSLSLGYRKSRDEFPTVSVNFLQLRHLSISNYYWTRDLFRFIEVNTPNLRSLKAMGYYNLPNLPTNLNIKHVYELHMNYPGSMVNLQMILSNFPCLRRLHINWYNYRNSLVMNGSQWQETIEKYLPHLKQWTVDFDQGIDEDIVKTFYTGELWSTKKVNVKMEINKTQSRFRLLKTIYFGKQWHFGYFDKKL